LIDWTSDATELLLNPRLPREERARLERLAARLRHPPSSGLRRAAGFGGHVWLATSGTSGPVKLVALGREALLASAAAVNRHLEASARDVWLNVLPLFHVGGLGILARAHLAGARVVGDHDAGGTPAAWSARSFVARAEETDATLSSLVPAQVYDLVRESLRAPPSLRAVVVGGGALPETLHAQARALGWPLLPSYGATECASQIATAALASLEEGRFPPLRLLPHVEAVTDPEGFLRIRSPALFIGYAVSPDPEGAESVALIDPKEEGWWTTEDRGSVKDDELRVEGRTSDFVKIGGESVRVPALEAILDELRAERSFAGDAALLPVPDERLGHVIVLVHAGAGDDEVAALQAAFNARVAPFERARRTHRLPRLPRTPLGKLMRDDALRAVGLASR